MKQSSNIITLKYARLRMVAGVLFTVMIHALFVSFTHSHPTKLSAADSSIPVLSQDHHTPEEHLPQQGHDSHCLACNLQRNLVAQDHSPVFEFTLAIQSLCRQTSLFELHSNGAFLLSTGRAPPLA